MAMKTDNSVVARSIARALRSRGSARPPYRSTMRGRSREDGASSLSACPDGGASHQKEDRRREHASLDDARRAVELKRPPYVARVRLAPARAHEGVIDQRLPIDARPGELQA